MLSQWTLTTRAPRNHCVGARHGWTGVLLEASRWDFKDERVPTYDRASLRALANLPPFAQQSRYTEVADTVLPRFLNGHHYVSHRCASISLGPRSPRRHLPRSSIGSSTRPAFHDPSFRWEQSWTPSSSHCDCCQRPSPSSSLDRGPPALPESHQCRSLDDHHRR